MSLQPDSYTGETAVQCTTCRSPRRLVTSTLLSQWMPPFCPTVRPQFSTKEQRISVRKNNGVGSSGKKAESEKGGKPVVVREVFCQVFHQVWLNKSTDSLIVLPLQGAWTLHSKADSNLLNEESDSLTSSQPGSSTRANVHCRDGIPRIARRCSEDSWICDCPSEQTHEGRKTARGETGD